MEELITVGCLTERELGDGYRTGVGGYALHSISFVVFAFGTI